MSSGGMIHNVIFFILAIGVLVTFHEFGHYWVARLLNVKVLRFSVGFGKPLIMWRRQRGEDVIEYAIAAIPLGGYVKMLDEREAPVDSKDLHRAFNRQPVFRRIAIVFAGPLFNFILAIFLYWAVFLNGEDGVKPYIGTPAENTAAAIAGFQNEDEILSVADSKVQTWHGFRMALIDHGIDGGSLLVTVRDANNLIATRELEIGDRHILDNKDDVIDQLGFNQWKPELPAIIGGTTDNGAAQKSGILVNDEVVAINGQDIHTWDQLVDIIQSSPGKPLEFLVVRNGKEQVLTVTPDSRMLNDKSSGFIGAYQKMPEEIIHKLRAHVEYGVFTAMQKAVAETWSMSTLTLRVLGKMLLGEAALENISGPITIAQFAGITASIGFFVYLKFLAMISVSLGVLNLLPVPMLDGGHLFYYLIEMIKGSPVSERFEELGQQIGLAILLMLMGLAIFNDIQRLIN